MMLLHMVESPRPIQRAVDGIIGERPRERMPHDAILDLDVDDRDAAQRAGVGRLPAAFGVERAAVERDRRAAAALGACDDSGVEIVQIRIDKIEPFGYHDASYRP